MTKKEILKIVISVLIAALTALAAGLGLSSCNVTRTVTTRSEAWQKGDTSVVIQTKPPNPSLIKEGLFVFLLSTFYFQLKIFDFACIYQKKVVILHAKLI